MRTVVALALAYGLAARLFDALWSARNARRVLARGGRRVRPDGFGALAAVHLGLLASIALEEVTLGPRAGGVTSRSTSRRPFRL